MRLYLGDTILLTDSLTDADGQPVDLTAASVVVVFSGSETMGGPATVEDAATGAVSFQQVSTVAGVFQARWVVTRAGVVSSFLGPSVRVMDPDATWATPADVEAILGPQSDPEEVWRAIDVATLLIASWCCVPPGDPLPPQFTVATALVASKLLVAPEPGSPVAETIGDYSYRLATAPGADALRAEIRQLLAPWLCGSVHSPRVWPGPEEFAVNALGEFQVDAEGLLRS